MTCIWHYPKETPPHEEDNLQKVELTFVAPEPIVPISRDVADLKQDQGSKSKSKEPNLKELKSKENKGEKCGASTSGRKSSKCGKASDGNVGQAPIDDDVIDIANKIAKSDTKPDTMSGSKCGRDFAFGLGSAPRLQIA